MAQGIVARFDPRRGYGFVRPDDGSEDVFVHQNNIVMEGFRYLKPGEQVSYELEIGEKGYKAVQVQLLSERVDEPPEREHIQAPAGERPRYERSYDRANQERRPPRHHGGGGDERLTQDLDRLRRKQERLISLLVGKGVLAAGEIDGVVDAVLEDVVDGEPYGDDANECPCSH